jgi:predicted tellurium resistance membrane protein TerC
MDSLFTGENAIALLALASLEIVLGIDNIVFLSILTGKLPEHQRAGARRVGLLLAMGMRIALLVAIQWVMSLTAVLFQVAEHPVTGRDLILILGGLFLVGKATWEIHDKLEGAHPVHGGAAPKRVSYAAILVQIVLIDAVFSLDSVITAVGMAREIEIMIAAVVIAVFTMMAFAGTIAAVIERHPTIKVLALAFLLLIGVVLVADGLGQHISKATIYTAMAFSLFVEMLNLRLRKATAPPVELHQSYVE